MKKNFFFLFHHQLFAKELLIQHNYYYYQFPDCIFIITFPTLSIDYRLELDCVYFISKRTTA